MFHAPVVSSVHSGGKCRTDNLQMHGIMGTVKKIQFRTTCGLCCKHPALFEYQDLYILLLLVFLIGDQLMNLLNLRRRRRSLDDERFSMPPWTYSQSQELAPVSARLDSTYAEKFPVVDYSN